MVIIKDSGYNNLFYIWIDYWNKSSHFIDKQTYHMKENTISSENVLHHKELNMLLCYSHEGPLLK